MSIFSLNDADALLQISSNIKSFKSKYEKMESKHTWFYFDEFEE